MRILKTLILKLRLFIFCIIKILKTLIILKIALNYLIRFPIIINVILKLRLSIFCIIKILKTFIILKIALNY